FRDRRFDQPQRVVDVRPGVVLSAGARTGPLGVFPRGAPPSDESARRREPPDALDRFRATRGGAVTGRRKALHDLGGPLRASGVAEVLGAGGYDQVDKAAFLKEFMAR